MIYQTGVGGFNNAGDVRMSSIMAVRFGQGGLANSSVWTLPATNAVYDVVTELTVSGSDAAGWTLDQTTTITGPGITGGSLMFNGNYTRTDAGFDGLQSISGIQLGYEPSRSSYTSGDNVVIDNVSITLIPEPSSGLLLGLGGLALLCRRPRRNS
jgi:hypothetical protein